MRMNELEVMSKFDTQNKTANAAGVRVAFSLMMIKYDDVNLAEH